MLHVPSPAAHSHHGHQPWEPLAVFTGYSALWLFLPKDTPIQDTCLCLLWRDFSSVPLPEWSRSAQSCSQRGKTPLTRQPGSELEALELDRPAQGGGTRTVLGLWASLAWAQWHRGTGHRAQWPHVLNSQDTLTWWEHTLKRHYLSVKLKGKNKKLPTFSPQFVSVRWVNSKCIWTRARLCQAK